MISINKQLRKYFIVVAIAAVLVIFVLSNLGISIFFNNYVKETGLKSDQKILQYIEDLLITDNRPGAEMATVPGLRQFIRGEGVEVNIYDLAGNLVFSSSASGGHGHGGMGHGRGMMSRINGSSDLELVFRSYPLKVDSEQVGTVEIGRPKNILASTEDRTFVLTMNIVYLLALVLALLVAMVISKYVTAKFLNPLYLVRNNILAIKSSASNKLQPVETKTAEIRQLAQATEDLAKTIKEQENLRKRLTSDIAHELRTPLATLQSHLEAMIDGVWEPTAERLSFCNDEVIRLTGLIKNLNELSVLESEATKLQITEVNLSELLKELCANYQLVFAEKEIELIQEIQPRVIVNADKDRLQQILVNILANAYKYTAEKGQVTVRLLAESEWAVLEVRDTGVGIAPEDLPHIFERFYRGDQSRSRQSGGAGIGLTIVKALVEAHRGTISVASELGKGTVVQIKIPRR
ncbi:MAG: hypothetical protein GX351_10205 [Peptococcaceae bacterium]|jgi:two-component system sensor histidine kinase BaeS|nr:hypothetical protein [Peptococcaceae bacterium]